MKSSALVKKTTPTQPSGGPDAFGYAPVKLAAFADGARVALPSGKPDWEKLKAAAAQPAAKVPSAEAVSTVATTPAADTPVDEIASLKADVDERRSVLVVMAQGKGDRVAPAQAPSDAPASTAVTAPATSSSENASAKDLIDPRKSVPAAISAVAHSADAVKVAAIDTTTKAIDAVQNRIGDTFKGDDTVTGSVAIDQMIEEAAAENNIPTELAYAVVRVESHYNPTAIGGGAYGLSQIKPATARGLGFDGPAKGLFDPKTNLRYGMKYLAGAWKLSGHDVCGTAMRYKGGHRTTTMSRAASIYCSNVKRHMAAIERRRGSANRETIVAANERSKQIAAASSTHAFDMRARAKVLAASVAASSQTGDAPAVGPVAATSAGQAVAIPAAAVAVPTPKGSSVAANIGANGIKSGRVRVYSDGEAAPAASTISSDGRFGYAE